MEATASLASLAAPCLEFEPDGLPISPPALKNGSHHALKSSVNGSKALSIQTTLAPDQAAVLAQGRDRLIDYYESIGLNFRDSNDDEPSFEIGKRWFDQDGNRLEKPIPMSRADALHPWEGDQLVATSLHALIIHFIFYLARLRYHLDPSFLWLVDRELNLGIEGYKTIRPDVAIALGVVNQRDLKQATFYVDCEQPGSLRFPLVVEVTSPSTRKNDFIDKVMMYSDCKEIEQYIIIDVEDGSIGFYEFRPGLRPEVSAGPRLDKVLVAALNVWMSSNGENLIFTDAQTGEVIKDFPDAISEFQERLKATQELLDSEKKRADLAEDRVKLLEKELEKFQKAQRS